MTKPAVINHQTLTAMNACGASPLTVIAEHLSLTRKQAYERVKVCCHRGYAKRTNTETPAIYEVTLKGRDLLNGEPPHRLEPDRAKQKREDKDDGPWVDIKREAEKAVRLAMQHQPTSIFNLAERIGANYAEIA